MQRRSGILLHPTSFPGWYPIGDIGDHARTFVDFLQASGQSLWQVLPLNPPDAFGSPYASQAASALTMLLVSPEQLVGDGFLSGDDLPPPQRATQHQTDYRSAEQLKAKLLERAWENFSALRGQSHRGPFEEFCIAEASWLDDFALFRVLRKTYGHAWWEWPQDLATREKKSLSLYRTARRGDLNFVKFTQWLMQRQWMDLKSYANKKNISIIGDLPFFVTLSSADVWVHQEEFLLGDRKQPTVVAGAPPDSFSAEGQRWGNPLYNWDVQKRNEYSWWRERTARAATLFDLIRLDHFRGYAGLWHISAGHADATNGHWEPSPGSELLQAIRDAAQDRELLIEDLGFITDDVHALREQLNLPRMRVTVFGFGDDARNPSLPANAEQNSVVMTSTHDTNTLKGFLEEADETIRTRALKYAHASPENFSWAIVERALHSRADTCIIALPDLLNLGSDVRMNTPGTSEGNWLWRFDDALLTRDLAERFRGITHKSGRNA